MILAGENTKPFDTKRSLEEPTVAYAQSFFHSLKVQDKTYTWNNDMERIAIIRKGIPYEVIENISKHLKTSISFILALMNIPQTTYNKKKKEQALLNSRDSELVLAISTLIDYGLDVFNQEEEKFQIWMKKPNLSLGKNVPENMLDTLTGINEVKHCLDRIEYGVFA